MAAATGWREIIFCSKSIKKQTHLQPSTKHCTAEAIESSETAKLNTLMSFLGTAGTEISMSPWSLKWGWMFESLEFWTSAGGPDSLCVVTTIEGVFDVWCATAAGVDVRFTDGPIQMDASGLGFPLLFYFQSSTYESKEKFKYKRYSEWCFII